MEQHARPPATSFSGGRSQKSCTSPLARGYVSNLWPVVTRTSRHATVFDHMTGNITHLKRDVVLNLEDWQCLPSKTIFALRFYTLAVRKVTPDLPSTILAQSGHAVTLIQKCASTGLKSWNIAMLLRLDKEEFDAVADGTTTAEIRRSRWPKP